MLANVFAKTLRDQRGSILGWGLGLGLLMMLVIGEYQQFVGQIAQQADFAQAYKSFGFLIGEYVPIDTLGGFLTLETVVYGSLVLGLWGVVAGVAVTRGEEELGALDVLLAQPYSRGRIFGQKIAALGASLGLISLLWGSLFVAGLALTAQTLPTTAVVATVFNVAVAAGFWGAAGVVLGQLVAARRTAAILGGALLFGTYLFNTVAETVAGLRGLTWITPFHYYNLSKPLVPGRALDWGGVLVLLAGTVVLLAAAAWLFAGRDIGAAVRLRPARPARRESLALLGSVFARHVRDLLVPTLLWGAGLGAYGILIIATANDALAPLYQSMNSLPWFTKLFGALVSNEAYLAVGVFFYLPLLVCLFALLQIWGWAGDEEEGRLEVLLSAPISRGQLVVARLAAALLSLAGMLLLMTAALLGTVALVHLQVDSGRIAGAVLATAAPVLVVLAGGLALTAGLPRPGAAAGVAGALVVGMFFVNVLAPLLDWPGWVLHLSIFHYYGRPVVDGVVWADQALLLGLALALAAVGLIGFQRRDIAK